MGKLILATAIFFASIYFNSFAQTNPPQNGDIAPDIILPNVSGSELRLSSLRGKVVLIDFWASWCGPCRMANEETIEVYEEYKTKGFEIFSISLDRKKEPWIRAIKDDGLPWPFHVCDFKEWNSETCTKYHVEALPTTYLIDENGHIISTDVDYYDLKKILKKHFNKINIFPRESNNQLITTSATKFEIQSEDGKTIFKGYGDTINIESLDIGNYLLKIDGREELFKKINSSGKYIKIIQSTNNVKFSEKCNVKLYNRRGYKVIEKLDNEEFDKSLLEKGDYLIWINGYVSPIHIF